MDRENLTNGRTNEMSGLHSHPDCNTIPEIVSNAPTLRQLTPGGDANALGRLTFPSFSSLLAEPNAHVLAVGAFDPQPVGLVLARVGASGTRLLSLFTAPTHRRRGIGGALLASVERLSRLAGSLRIETTYRTGTPGSAAFEATLARAGWSRPELRQLFCRTSPQKLASALTGLYRPSARYRVVAWADVSADERNILRCSQVAESWYPPDLDPFFHEEGYEPLTSVALRTPDGIVGWLIAHRVGPSVIRYSCAYVHPKLQRTARLLELYLEAAFRQTAAFGPDSRVIGTVPVAHANMTRFVRHRVTPFLQEFAEFRGSQKHLGPSSQRRMPFPTEA
ncbi:MAG: GNAT family N-acetyltransferase [Terrimicrobiaceae bacterium]|nr:GNAT family N-acetyltransferase [Terrimicrobiaceae bacterium]